MRIARRIAFLLGFLPVSIYAGGYWVLTGKDPLDILDKYIDWGSK